MMTLSHESVFPRLSEYLDGELPSGESEAVQSHVAICQDCTRGLGELTAALDAMRALRTEPDALDLAPVRQAVRAAAQRVEPDRFWALNLPRMFPNFAGAALASAMLIALGVMLIPLARGRAKPKPSGMVIARLEQDNDVITQLPEAPASAPVAAASAPEGARQNDAPVLAALGGAAAAEAPADSPASRGTRGDALASTETRMADLKADAGKAGAAAEPLMRREAASSQEETETAGSRDEAAGVRKELFADKDQRAEKPAAAPPPVYSPALSGGEPGPSAQGSLVTSDTRYRIAPREAVLMADGNRIAGATERDVVGEKKAGESSRAAAPASQPGRALQKQKKSGAVCRPSAPEFPAFPNIRPSDHMRLPLEFTVALDGGGHVVDVTHRALPGQLPLANEIAAWLRRQTVHPMICDGSGVAGEVQLTFSWDEEAAP